VEPAADDPPLGKLFKVGDLLHVQEGVVVTLLGDDGSVTELPGPADILVTEDAPPAGQAAREQAAEGASKLASIAAWLANGGAQVESIGASRGLADGSGLPGADSPWSVYAEQPSAACVRDGALVLRRSGTGRAALSIGFDDTAPRGGLVWEAGAPTFVVAGGVPPGARSVWVGIDGKSTRIPLAALPANVDPENQVDVLTWMIASGCRHQAAVMVDRLAHGGGGTY
jgi:hypothetical protein